MEDAVKEMSFDSVQSPPFLERTGKLTPLLHPGQKNIYRGVHGEMMLALQLSATISSSC